MMQLNNTFTIPTIKEATPRKIEWIAKTRMPEIQETPKTGLVCLQISDRIFKFQSQRSNFGSKVNSLYYSLVYPDFSFLELLLKYQRK